MSEQDQRRKVVTALSSLHAISVENRAYPGTPDVNFVDGWLELKWMRAWPVNDDTVVAIDHFRPEQRVWLYERYTAGGNVGLLLQINRREWLLFDGATASRYVGRVTRAELITRAHAYWPAGLGEPELLQCVRSRYPMPRST